VGSSEDSPRPIPMGEPSRAARTRSRGQSEAARPRVPQPRREAGLVRNHQTAKRHRVFEAVIAVRKLGATRSRSRPGCPPAERRAIIDLANPSLTVGVEPSDHDGPDDDPGRLRAGHVAVVGAVATRGRRVIQGADIRREREYWTRLSGYHRVGCPLVSRQIRTLVVRLSSVNSSGTRPESMGN
jgi:hypothetical protein